MSNLAPLRKSLLIVSTAVWVLSVAPTGFAQDEPDQAADVASKTGSAADLRRQETELRNAVKADPNNADAHLKLSRFYFDGGNYPAAEAEAREAKKSGASPDEEDPLLSQILLLENKTSQLFAQIQPADREPDAESAVRLNLGRAHFSLREFAAAEPLLRDAVRLNPKSFRAHLALADFFLVKGPLSSARDEIEAARPLGPPMVVTRYTGVLLRAEGDTNGAIAEFDKIVAQQPNSVTALDDRADALLSQDKVNEAQRDIDAALKVGPKNPETVYLSVLLLARLGKMGEADAKLATLGDTFVTRPTAFYLEGAIKFGLGQYEQADASLAKFIGRQPDAPGAHRLRAEIALHRQDPAGAIEQLKPVVAANPGDQGAVAALARVYADSGHPDQAVDLYEQAAAQSAGAAPQPSLGEDFQDMAEIDRITSFPQDADAVAPLLVLVALRHGDVEKASSIAEPLAKRAPNDPVIQNLLGSVRLAQKRLPDAEAIFRDITKRQPEFAAASHNLAEVLVAENRPDEAKAVLQNLAQRTSQERQR